LSRGGMQPPQCSGSVGDAAGVTTAPPAGRTLDHSAVEAGAGSRTRACAGSLALRDEPEDVVDGAGRHPDRGAARPPGHVRAAVREESRAAARRLRPAHGPAHNEKATTKAAANPLEKLELVTGIEPVTPSLRVTCSTS